MHRLHRTICRVGLIGLLPALLASCTLEEAQTAPLPAPPAAAPVLMIPPVSAQAAEVPEGYEAEVVVRQLNFPTAIEFDDRGNLFIAEAGAAPGSSKKPPRILRISPTGQIDVMTEKLIPPVVDLIWYDEQLYVFHGGRVSVLTPKGELHDFAARLPDMDVNAITEIPNNAISPGQPFGYEGSVFYAEFGDVVPEWAEFPEDDGHRVMRANPLTGEVQSFFQTKPAALGPPGLEYVLTAGPKRPTDVRFAPDGSALYVADFGAVHATPQKVRSYPETGVVWRIVPKGARVLQPPGDLSPPPQLDGGGSAPRCCEEGASP